MDSSNKTFHCKIKRRTAVLGISWRLLNGNTTHSMNNRVTGSQVKKKKKKKSSDAKHPAESADFAMQRVAHFNCDLLSGSVPFFFARVYCISRRRSLV